jgi:hypothetical protein
MYSLLFLIRALPSEGRTSWARSYFNLATVLMRTVLRVPPGTYRYASSSCEGPIKVTAEGQPVYHIHLQDKFDDEIDTFLIEQSKKK